MKGVCPIPPATMIRCSVGVGGKPLPSGPHTSSREPARNSGKSRVILPTTRYTMSRKCGFPAASGAKSYSANGRPSSGSLQSANRNMTNCPGTIRRAISGQAKRMRYVSRANCTFSATVTWPCQAWSA